MGAVGYADDLILLAPSRGDAQKMLKRCESFAQEHNILFSTDPDPAKSAKACCSATVWTRSAMGSLS